MKVVVAMSRKNIPMSLQLVTTAMNAAVYAGVGALWTVFPVTVYGIRFWPQVFVPATFSVLFGAWTGGVGAAIGIFLADVIYGHHDALLSLLVGVPSNFLGFFIIGWLTNRSQAATTKRVLMVVSLLIPVTLAGYGIFLLAGPMGFETPQLLIAFVGLIAVVAILGLTVVRNKWANFEAAASIGLGIGSIIIGLGIVAYSLFFTLPAVVGKGPLPTSVIYAATTFTYLSEIPFLVLLTPPIVAACRAAFPSLRLGASSTESKKR
jgi:hypothetical protein